MTEWLKNYGRRFITLQEAVTITIPKQRECRKAKWLSEEALQITVKRREVKIKEKRKDIGI